MTEPVANGPAEDARRPAGSVAATWPPAPPHGTELRSEPPTASQPYGLPTEHHHSLYTAENGYRGPGHTAQNGNGNGHVVPNGNGNGNVVPNGNGNGHAVPNGNGNGYPSPYPDVNGGRDPVDPFGTGPMTGPYGAAPRSVPYGSEPAEGHSRTDGVRPGRSRRNGTASALAGAPAGPAAADPYLTDPRSQDPYRTQPRPVEPGPTGAEPYHLDALRSGPALPNALLPNALLDDTQSRTGPATAAPYQVDGPQSAPEYLSRARTGSVPVQVQQGYDTWSGASVRPRGPGSTGAIPVTGGSRTRERPGRGPAPVEQSRRGMRLRPTKRASQSPLRAGLGAMTEVVVVLGMALGLSFLIKAFLVQAFFIPSQSMEDTLLIGDRVLVSKLNPQLMPLHRGDVIVFEDPANWLQTTTEPDNGPVQNGIRATLTAVGLLPEDAGEHLIKRVIGMPGDTVMCCDAKGRLQVNGVSIDEPYVRAGNVPSLLKFTATVKPGNLWVMGDNRSESADSRLHRDKNDGQVPIDKVTGKAFVIVWPFPRFGGVSEPPNVFAAVPPPQPR